MGAWYTTREAVAASPDIRATAYAAAQLDREIESASRRVDRLCHVPDEGFAPTTATRYFPYPNSQHAFTGRLWFDQHRPVSIDTFTAGGVTIPATDYFLEPVNDGPPYTSIEIDRASASALAMNSGTSQRSLVLAGTWCACRVNEETAGTITAGINSSAATMPVSLRAGVGDILRIDSERVRVVDKMWLTSGQTGTLTAANNAQSLAVSDGTAFAVGEDLLIDAERLFVRDISANTLIVQRAWSGSTLAAHTTATIYQARTLVVLRGAFGSTAASHSSGATVYRHVLPGPIEQLTRAYALDGFFQSGAGWARTVGQGDSERQASGRAIAALAEEVYGSYARKGRMRAI